MARTPIVLDAQAVEQFLPQADVMAVIRQMFRGLGQKLAVQPPQSLTLLPDGKGDFITYLGAIASEGVFGAKLSPYLVQEGGPIITAWTVLMSLESGQPLCLCDSGMLTTERTAATTALAVDFLSGPDAKRITIIGSGAVAKAHWRYVSALRPWQDVQINSPSLAKDEGKRADWLALCPDANFASSAEEAAENADVIMLCTSSGTPVLDAASVQSHALVTSVSTNVAEAHEISPSFLNSAQVYCDYRETTPSTAGEMIIAARDHDWRAEEVRGDLAELSVKTCPLPEADRPVFFRSVGLGLEDIAVALAIYRAATSD